MSRRDASAPEHSAQPTALEAPHPGLDDVVDYRSGGLAAERRLRLEQHLAGCPDCRARLAVADAALENAALIAEHPIGAESLEVELLLERLRLTHEIRWANRERPERSSVPRRWWTRWRPEICSPHAAIAARVSSVAKAKRKAANAEEKDTGVDQVFALWRSGDLRSARAAARTQLAGSPSESDRAKLERVLRDTSPDPRALQVSAFCLAVVAIVVLLTKFFG